MADRTLFYAATPEVAYLIARDRVFPGDDPNLELVARRNACPGGTAVGVRLSEEQLSDAGSGRYLVARDFVDRDRITRAFQPWHADVETDRRARWKGYLQEESFTLRNLVGADTPGTLRTKEDDRVAARALELRERPVSQTFDLAHLKQIHRRLFQDVYPWAGETRTVDMGRPGGPGFLSWEGIESAWDTIEEKLEEAHHLVGATREVVLDQTARIYNWINTTHAFREGNGRSQRMWMDDLAAHAGYRLDWPQVEGRANDLASQAGREGDQEPLRKMFDTVIVPDQAPRPADEAARAAVLTARKSYAVPATEATRAPGRGTHNDRVAEPWEVGYRAPGSGLGY